MPNHATIAQFSADRFQVVFSAAFGDCVGTYGGEGKMTIADLADATGIKPRTLEAYRDGEMMPRGSVLFVLMGVLPPRFANRLLAEIGLGGARKMTPEQIDFHNVAAKASEYSNLFVQHMSDGRIDHIEQIEEINLARKMHDVLGRFLHSVDAPKIPGDDGKVTKLAKRAGA